ncbi:class I SAM-dependent methyltransferase [Deinococcus planocerae]|uniref:class I SAM-dependent methyltransferase n=1 Tax=Deinococcus planocerae TaxID=1737569 RepID=UPI000C7EBEB7|nr:class I SAM-dependent methyltransferase [Deinococcus planocerae]
MNTYTPTWFELFLATIEPAQTEREADFLARQLPLPALRRVLDLCCGTGRHAHALARRGYEVLGVDRDPDAVEKARAQAPEVCRFLVGDMRDLSEVPGDLDAALVLWQSFGFFDEATNAAVLRGLHGRLRPGGRLILDVYHRDFFEAHQGEGHFTRGGLAVAEHKRMAGGRLRVELDYGGEQEGDAFDWQLYTPGELEELARSVGLTCLLACTGFDERQPASAASPRMQLVFAREG